jgi:hypothetical protein
VLGVVSQLASPEELTGASLHKVITVPDGAVAWNVTLPVWTTLEASVTVTVKVVVPGRKRSMSPPSQYTSVHGVFAAGLTLSASGKELDDPSLESPE